MEITISLKEAGLIIIGIGVIVLIGYCISFMKNLVITVKNTNRILEDTQVITGMAVDKSKELDKIVSDVVFSVGKVSEAVKGNQSVVQAITSLVNATTALQGLIRKMNRSGDEGRPQKNSKE